jgi:hypothetical protein
MTPRVLQWRRRYWTEMYPRGIADIASADMIDVDEAKIGVEESKRGFAKAHVTARSRCIGPYGRDRSKVLLMAISADPDNGERWYEFEERRGTDLLFFYEFILRILRDLGPGTPARRRCFILDNLNIHHNPIIVETILQAGHRLAFRAPYYPVDGPIEYVFNTIECSLQNQVFSIDNLDDVTVAVTNTIRAIVAFDAYFYHVGYR